MPGEERKYQAIARELRAAILDGTYGPGAQLPSEQDLMTSYGVSLMTVRQALDVLVSEGKVVKQKGKRAEVRAYQPKIRDGIARLGPSTWPAGLDIWSADADGRDYRADNVQVSIGEAPPLAAALLGLDSEQDRVIIRDRRYFLDGKPILLAVSYIPASIAGNTAITMPDTGPGGTYARLAEAGLAPVRFREDLRARMPDEDEITRLELVAGTPVVDITRTAWAETGAAVEVNMMVADAGSHIFRYDWSSQISQ